MSGARWLGMLVGLGLAAGCVMPSVPWPSWVDQPKREDSLCLYALGHASRARSEAAARDMAFRNAVAQFSSLVLTKAEPGGSATATVALELRGVEVVAGASEARHQPGGWEAYVLASWPRADHERAVERVTLGMRLNACWDEANAAAAARQWGQAIAKLEAILADFRDPLNARFTVDAVQQKLQTVKRDRLLYDLNSTWMQAQADVEAGRLTEARSRLDSLLEAGPSIPPEGPAIDRIKLLSGEVCERQADTGGARRAYEALAKTAVDLQVRQRAQLKLESLPPAPRMWPMNERWGSAKVALACAIQDGAGMRAFTDLSAMLQKECIEARLESVDLSATAARTGVEPMAGNEVFPGLVDNARREGAGVLLAVSYAISPGERARTETIGGIAVPVPDARVTFAVIRVDSGALVYRGQFKAVTEGKDPARLAPYAASILVAKYLVPFCPALK